LANDDWGDASPSRKMVELWRDLSGDSDEQRVRWEYEESVIS
jgi:hypothetical protein